MSLEHHLAQVNAFSEEAGNRRNFIIQAAKLSLGGGLGLYFLGCSEATVTSPENVTIDVRAVGEIKGIISWDLNGDGIYTGAPGVDVGLNGCPKSPGSKPEYLTKTVSGGLFSFINVSSGSYSLCAETGYIDNVWYRVKTGVTVQKQGVADVGELKLNPL